MRFLLRARLGASRHRLVGDGRLVASRIHALTWEDSVAATAYGRSLLASNARMNSVQVVKADTGSVVRVIARGDRA
jgi:hypothetical protein